MAEGKKSFIAYSDWYGMFKALPDDVAGKLIKHIFSYVNDENPSSDEFVINALFEQVKSTLKRDLKKWEDQQEQRIKAGLRSAEVRKQNATIVNARSISSTVSVNDSVSVKEIKENNISLSLESDFTLFWEKYGKKNDSKKCKEKFFKLPKKDIETILKIVDSYVVSTPDIQFRKNPLTWLNGKCWNDVEINEFLPTKEKPFGKTNQI